MPTSAGLFYIVERHKSGSVTAHKRWYQGGSHLTESLDLRRDLEDYADHFDCGFPGSAAAQLALALCADALDNDTRAMKAHLDFSSAIISRLGAPTDPPFVWNMTRSALVITVEKIERQGWRKVAEMFDRNRAYATKHAGHRAFRHT